jgi:hypothetical protein
MLSFEPCMILLSYGGSSYCIPWRRNLSHEEYSGALRKNHLGDVEALTGALDTYPGVIEAYFKAKFSSC